MADNPGTRIVTKIIFPVRDMSQAVGFYRRLGFEVENYDDGYAWVRNKGMEILHLAAAAELTVEDNPAAGYFHVQDTDAWHGAWSDLIPDLEPVTDRPWGMREFSFKDPSGNLLRVGQNL